MAKVFRQRWLAATQPQTWRCSVPKSKGLTRPKWAAPDNLQVGHLALALRRPGKDVRATLGIVSTLGKAWHTPACGSLDRYLQTDVVIYPGFSGVPLLDASGGDIGLNTSAILRGISITVPVPTVRRVVESLLSHGRIRRAYLGVGTQPVRLPVALAEQLDQKAGLLLVSVETESEAEQHGLLLGDTIVALDGRPVRQVDDLLALLSGDKISVAVPVSVIRGDEVCEITVTVGERTW